MMMKYVRCKDNPVVPPEAPNEPKCKFLVNPMFEVPLFYGLIGLHVCFSILIETACFEWEPFDKHFTSCYTPLPTIVTSTLKAVKVVLFSLFDTKPDTLNLVILVKSGIGQTQPDLDWTVSTNRLNGTI
jgi:hypothetical protein